MQTIHLLKKGRAVGIIFLFCAIAWSTAIAQESVSPINEQIAPRGSLAVKGGHATVFQGFDLVMIWGTFEEKIRKFPLLSLEVRNRDPWDNRTISVFGLFKEGTSFRVYFIKAYWVTCLPLRSLHLGVVGQNSLFVVASGRITVYQ